MRKGSIFIVLFLAIVLSGCEAERFFNVSILNDFVDSLEDEYEFINDIKIRQSQGHIILKVYFDSDSISNFDDSIYDDIRDYFLQTDVQETIIEKFDPDTLIGDEYPYIKVRFLDSSELESHFIRSPINTIEYGKSEVTENRYGTWTEPFYYNSKSD